MIVDLLRHADRYALLHPLFGEGIEFLRREDLAALSPGRLALRGDDLFAIVQHETAPAAPTVAASPSDPSGVPLAPPRLEAHRRYIDLQYAVRGSFSIGWRPVRECRIVAERYCADKDLVFYGDPYASTVVLPEGTFAILYPEDAHAPGLVPDSGTLIKVVLKIAVDFQADGAG